MKLTKLTKKVLTVQRGELGTPFTDWLWDTALGPSAQNDLPRNLISLDLWKGLSLYVMDVRGTPSRDPRFGLISSTMVSVKCIVGAKQRWSEHELTSVCTGGLNVDDLMARPDLAMRYNYPNEGVPASANAPPLVPFCPPAASNNGPGVASPPASRPVSYQNQQVAGQNQPISPPRLHEDFDPLQANPAAAALAGNTAPGQLPAQFPGYNWRMMMATNPC